MLGYCHDRLGCSLATSLQDLIVVVVEIQDHHGRVAIWQERQLIVNCLRIAEDDLPRWCLLVRPEQVARTSVYPRRTKTVPGSPGSQRA
jgi:hypothetical protein